MKPQLKNFIEQIGKDAIAIIPAAHEATRSYDTEFKFQQDPDFYYLTGFPEPDAIAVIGASPEQGKIGYAVMENIINGGYQGQLYPINPRADVILGRPCYRSVKDIPGAVDIAIFCIPARFVAQV